MAQPSSANYSSADWLRAAGAAKAEVVVLNTCTVTASADQDVRASIRRIHRRILMPGSW